jgi:hypothetical protein
MTKPPNAVILQLAKNLLFFFSKKTLKNEAFTTFRMTGKG